MIHYGIDTVIPFFLVVLILGFVSLLAFKKGNSVSSTIKINLTDSIPSSILGLLALILGFTFSLVVQRYELRRSLTIQEANSISSAYYRGKILYPVEGYDLTKLYKAYVKNRIHFYEHLKSKDFEKYNQIDLEIKDQIWKHFEEVIKVERSALPSAYLYAITEMFDKEEERTYALRRSLPWSLYLLLILLSSITIGSLYFDRGYSNENVHWRPILLIICFALMVGFIYDMDHPTSGIVQISQEAMTSLHDIIK